MSIDESFGVPDDPVEVECPACGRAILFLVWWDGPMAITESEGGECGCPPDPLVPPLTFLAAQAAMQRRRERTIDGR